MRNSHLASAAVEKLNIPWANVTASFSTLFINLEAEEEEKTLQGQLKSATTKKTQLCFLGQYYNPRCISS